MNLGRLKKIHEFEEQRFQQLVAELAAAQAEVQSVQELLQQLSEKQLDCVGSSPGQLANLDQRQHQFVWTNAISRRQIVLNQKFELLRQNVEEAASRVRKQRARTRSIESLIQKTAAEEKQHIQQAESREVIDLVTSQFIGDNS